MDGELDEYIQAGYRYAYAYNYYLQAKKDLREAKRDGYENEIEQYSELVQFHKDEVDECKEEILKAAKGLFSEEDDYDEDGETQ